MQQRLFYLLGFVFIAAACNHSHTHDTMDHHEEETPTLKLTAYTESYEIFAECTPLSLGDTAFVLAHFTHLEDFKPLEDAQMTLRLSTTGSQLNSIAVERLKAGIFKFKIVPDQIGKGELHLIMGSDSQEFIRLADVIVFKDADEAIRDASAKQASSDNRIVFTKEQSWKVPFKTSLPQVMSFGPVVHTTGLVQESNDESIYLTSPMDGVVQFSQKQVVPGKALRKGEKILQIQSAGLIGNDMQIQSKEAETKYQFAKEQYNRAEKLAKDRIVSDKELTDLKNQYELAKIQYNRFQSQLSSGAKSISASNDGILSELYVGNGEFVHSGQKLAKLSTNQSFLIKAEIPLRYASIVKDLEDAMLSLPSSRETASILALGGAILPQKAVISNSNQLIPIYFQIPANDQLVAGMFIETALKFKGPDSALIIPKTALIENLGVFYVFVQITPELFEKRKIITGANDGMNFKVMQGLQSDERIVTEGAILVKLAEASGALDAHAGHHH